MSPESHEPVPQMIVVPEAIKASPEDVRTDGVDADLIASAEVARRMISEVPGYESLLPAGEPTPALETVNPGRSGLGVVIVPRPASGTAFGDDSIIRR